MSQKQEILLKPITVRIVELQKNLNEVVAESQLPPYILEMVIGQYLAGVSNVAQQEYAQDAAGWESEQKAVRAKESAETAIKSAGSKEENDG